MTVITTSAATLSHAAADFAASAIASAIAGNPDRIGASDDLRLELTALRDALGQASFEAQEAGAGVHVRADFVLI